MVEMSRGGGERNDREIKTSNDGEADNSDRKPTANPMVVEDGGKGVVEETCIALNNIVIKEGGAEAVVDGGKSDNISERNGNDLGRGKEETTLTDGAKYPGGYGSANGSLVDDGLVEDMDKTREEMEMTLTDGAKDLGGNAGANGSTGDDTNEIVIKEGDAEAVADRGRNNNVFEGEDNDLGQGEDRTTLTDGAKDADAYASGNGSLENNIDEIGKETETMLTDGAKNQVGNMGADSRSVKDMNEIVEKSTGGDEGAEEGPVNNIDWPHF